MKVKNAEDSDPSPWQDFLLKHARQDLLKIAEDRRLYYLDDSLQLHWLDRVSLLLVRQAHIHRQSLALCYPVPTCNLPILAAAQLLIHDLVQNYSLHNRLGNLSILLISSRMEVREHYLNLRVKREPLACALPLARIRAGGEPAIIPVPGKSSEQSRFPRLYHLSRPHLLDTSWPKKLGVVIVDHTADTFDEYTMHIQELAMCRGIQTTIHLYTDPFSFSLESLSEAGVPVWVWDHHGLATDFGEQIAAANDAGRHPLSASNHQFQNISAGIRHHVLACSHPKFEAAACRVWDDLSTVQRTFSGQAGLGIHRAIRAAYGTFYSMFQMLVPLPVYEEEARNLWGIRAIQRRIEDLGEFARLLRSESPDLAEIYWPSLILDLKEMRNALMEGNPKYEELVQQVHHHQSQKRSLAIVCPNQASRRMLQLCLRAQEGLRLSDLEAHDSDCVLRLITYKELQTLTSCDVLLFPGQFSYGRRRYTLTAAAPEIRYLSYGDEADRIERQVADIHQTLAQSASAQEKTRVWSLLAPHGSDDQPPERNDEKSAAPTVEFVRSEGKRVSARDTTRILQAPETSIWTPFSTIEYDLVRGKDVLSQDAEEALRPSEFADEVRQDVFVPALYIEFLDGFCYAEPDSRMTVFLPATEKINDRRAEGLRPDDIILFVDGDQQRHLYEAILERIEQHSAMGVTYILTRYWQQAVREGFFRSGLAYDDLLRQLQRLGSQIQTSTAIYCWVQGWVLGPRDGQDIRRMGEILDDQTLVHEWKDINRAVKKVRNLHRSLARKLNRTIVEAGLRGRHTEASDECIDQDLNLYVDDFRDSVTLHRIVAVSSDAQSVPYVFTGQFFEKGTEIKW